MAHTNSELFYKNSLINKYVGGTTNKQTLKEGDVYINEQLGILKDQNQKLYPNLRYGQSAGPIGYDTYHKKSADNLLSPQQSGGCCGKGQDTMQNLNYQNTNTNTNTNTPNIPVDTYLSKNSDKYDPYTGYLYDRGLLSDGNQKRRLIYNYVDINSAFRRKQSVISIGKEYQLAPNPLTFTNGSSSMHITIDPTIFNINDPITITNVIGKFATLRTIRGVIDGINLPAFEILVGYNFMKIWYDHHIPESYPSTRSTIRVKISGVIGDPKSVSTLLGNIPVNVINVTHTVKLTLTSSDIKNIEQITAIDPNYFDYSPEYFFVILPLILQSPYTPITDMNYNFNILFNSLEAIPLNTINTSFQINPNQLTSFHIIKDIDSTGISITLPFTAITDTDSDNNNTTIVESGGNFIILGQVTGIDVGYPNPNNYKISLPAVYNNVISIRLVSTEIPNANKTVRNYPPESANNKLYWNDIDDGDYLYSVSVPAGNYTPADLITALTTAFAATPRINASTITDYTSTHFIQTTINLNTSEVTFSPYKEFILQQPITDIEPPISQDPNVPEQTDKPYTITITQPNHGAQPGESILIQNAINDSGIPSTVINGTHVVASVLDLNQYTVELPRFNLSSNRTVTGGGTNVFIYVPDTVRFRFDQPNTLGTVLGFRNPGDPLSITPYTSVISNAAPYELELNTNILGQQINITNNALQFAGDNYMIMNAAPVQIYSSISAIKTPFAKIILCDSPGKILYNSFVSMTQLYENPISTLSDLTIEFYTPDGALVNFDGLEHSFTLEIVTVEDIPKDTRINANTGKNYNQYA
jgi:hypothetical protein